MISRRSPPPWMPTGSIPRGPDRSRAARRPAGTPRPCGPGSPRASAAPRAKSRSSQTSAAQSTISLRVTRSSRPAAAARETPSALRRDRDATSGPRGTALSSTGRSFVERRARAAGATPSRPRAARRRTWPRGARRTSRCSAASGVVGAAVRRGPRPPRRLRRRRSRPRGSAASRGRPSRATAGRSPRPAGRRRASSPERRTARTARRRRTPHQSASSNAPPRHCPRTRAAVGTPRRLEVAEEAVEGGRAAASTLSGRCSSHGGAEAEVLARAFEDEELRRPGLAASAARRSRIAVDHLEVEDVCLRPVEHDPLDLARALATRSGWARRSWLLLVRARARRGRSARCARTSSSAVGDARRAAAAPCARRRRSSPRGPSRGSRDRAPERSPSCRAPGRRRPSGSRAGPSRSRA